MVDNFNKIIQKYVHEVCMNIAAFTCAWFQFYKRKKPSKKEQFKFNQYQIKNVTNNFFLIVLCLSATFELMATTINSNKLQNTNQLQTKFTIVSMKNNNYGNSIQPNTNTLQKNTIKSISTAKQTQKQFLFMYKTYSCNNYHPVFNVPCVKYNTYII